MTTGQSRRDLIVAACAFNYWSRINRVSSLPLAESEAHDLLGSSAIGSSLSGLVPPRRSDDLRLDRHREVGRSEKKTLEEAPPFRNAPGSVLSDANAIAVVTKLSKHRHTHPAPSFSLLLEASGRRKRTRANFTGRWPGGRLSSSPPLCSEPPKGNTLAINRQASGESPAGGCLELEADTLQHNSTPTIRSQRDGARCSATLQISIDFLGIVMNY